MNAGVKAEFLKSSSSRDRPGFGPINKTDAGTVDLRWLVDLHYLYASVKKELHKWSSSRDRPGSSPINKIDGGTVDLMCVDLYNFKCVQ